VTQPRLAPLALALAGGLAAAACTPGSPCRTADFRKAREYSLPYAGHWVVARGDTLTLPEMGDRFRLGDVVLDTDTVVVRTGRTAQCHLGGRLVFTVPRPETLAVSWFGAPEHVTIFGWPAELGPFAGISASWWGRDSLHGAILFDERLGVQMRPGITAQFWAGRR
jgi:hypothetical protein